MRGIPSPFFSRFSLRELVKKNGSTSGLLCAEGGIGAARGGGGGVDSNRATFSKSETFSCQIKSSGANKFDEPELISSLKRDVEEEEEIRRSGLKIKNSESPNSSSFYFEYEEEDEMKGRVESFGERRERYYVLEASLRESGERKTE